MNWHAAAEIHSAILAFLAGPHYNQPAGDSVAEFVKIQAPPKDLGNSNEICYR